MEDRAGELGSPALFFFKHKGNLFNSPTAHEISGMNLNDTMACPKCGNVVAATDQFCAKCFTRLERPTFWQNVTSWIQIPPIFRKQPLVIKKKVVFETVNKQGEKHIYHSLDEVPPELRANFEKVQAEVAKELEANEPPSDAPKDVPSPGTIIRRRIFLYKFKDASGNEQTYHSLEEMPPEVRVMFENAQGSLKLPGPKTES